MLLLQAPSLLLQFGGAESITALQMDLQETVYGETTANAPVVIVQMSGGL